MDQVRPYLEAFAAEMLGGLARSDQRAKGELYLRGLLLDGKRKSMHPMAERLGVDHQQLQQFVTSSTWDHVEVRRRIAQWAENAIGADAFAIDDVGFPKDGSDSPGVARMYSGALGKVGAVTTVGWVMPGDARQGPAGRLCAQRGSCAVRAGQRVLETGDAGNGQTGHTGHQDDSSRADQRPLRACQRDAWAHQQIPERQQGVRAQLIKCEHLAEHGAGEVALQRGKPVHEEELHGEATDGERDDDAGERHRQRQAERHQRVPHQRAHRHET